MEKEKVKQLINLLKGVSYKDWKAVEQYVNMEFQRLANKNTLTNCEGIVKNIMLDYEINSSIKNTAPEVPVQEQSDLEHLFNGEKNFPS